MEPKYQQQIPQGKEQQPYQQEKKKMNYKSIPLDGQTCKTAQTCRLHFVQSESKLVHPEETIQRNKNKINLPNHPAVYELNLQNSLVLSTNRLRQEMAVI